MPQSNISLGQIAFLGSGETSYAGGRIFEALAKHLPRPLRAAILETPAGFELNAAQVAERVADFLRSRLQNYQPLVETVPARRRGTEASPDNPDVLGSLLQADLIFMGPGSPTYAVRQLHDSLAWHLVRARHRQGATLVFASAAAISVGACVLPVYEIFKVGEEVHFKSGLDLFGSFGLPLSFIPHWNNAEGGADVDTSRCFVGLERFDEWRSRLPPEQTLIGLDEHTGLIWDLAAGECRVSGAGSVTVLRAEGEKVFENGAHFDIHELGAGCSWPEPKDDIPAQAWEMLGGAEEPETITKPPAEVQALAEARQQARLRKDWAESDRLRAEIAALGWAVQDTPNGPLLVRA